MGELFAPEVSTIPATALIFLLCFAIAVALVIAANTRVSSIFEEVNQRLPDNAQINLWGFGAQWRLFEVLRLHSEMYPNSPKRQQMWILTLSGYAIGFGAFIFFM
jgi:hypothetical protein